MVFIGASQLSAGVSGMAIFFVLGVISLLEGIFSIRGARDASKIMPAWIFAILGVIGGIGTLISSIGDDAKGVAGAIVGVALSILIFIAANTIKKSNG